jgi:iron complex transport system substrate-binding protein
VEDAAGRTLALDAPPRRIVSLVPSVGPIVRALGAGERLVGRTDFDTAAAVSELPSVGGGLHPSVEVLASLRPDLVIRFAGESDTDTPARLDDLGIPHLAVRPDGIADIRTIIRQLGVLLAAPDRADSLVSALDAGLEAVRRSTGGRPPVRAAFLLGGRPPWVAGPGTFIDELLRLAGGENVFHDLDRLYAPVSPEVLRSRRVDVVLTGPNASLDPALLGTARHVALPAFVELPGLDLPAAARAVAHALHPDLRP